jgi:N-acetylglucosamine-6-sulfatase
MFGCVSFFITALFWLFALYLAVAGSIKQNDRSTSQPNIVFIFTDDQDVHLNSLDYMPLLKQHLTDQGTSFPNHYCTVSLCCPSRASLWTGKAAHNTNVTDLAPPYGLFSSLPKQS